MRAFCAITMLLALTSLAHAQVELKNDSFQSGGQATYQGGFVAGEAAASRFIAPSAGLTLQRVTFIFGGSTATTTVLVHVWDDTAGNDAPGAELKVNQFQVMGSDSGFQVAELSTQNIVLPAQFRVGIEFQQSGLPSVASDKDNTIAVDRNFILADMGGGNHAWVRSQSLGVSGDWIIRAEVSSGSTTAVDAGAPSDAPIAGGPCAGNSQCPTGQYCDLAAMTCTYDCRSEVDCGGHTCNSLGQCVGLNGDGGSCACRADGGTPLGLVLGVFVLFLLVRRR